MSKLGELLGYTSEPCPNCGRLRVEAWSSGRHVCEKCGWCLEDDGYYFEEAEETILSPNELRQKLGYSEEEFDHIIDTFNSCQPGYLLSRNEIQKLMVAHGSRNLHTPL